MTIRVLVAEDSPTQAEALRTMLDDAGYDVEVASDGDKALSAYALHKFALVVSDVMMPGMNGFDLCRGIKDDFPDPPPVVLLTSLRDPMDLVRALECGADAFLRKPIDAEGLKSRLATLLANRRLRSGSAFQVGIELDFREQRFLVTSERQQLLDLLVSTFEDLVASNQELRIRERELAEIHRDLAEQLHLTEYEYDRLRTVLTSVPEPLILTDPRLLVLEINAAAAFLLGIDAADATGRPLSHVLRVERVDGEGVSDWPVALDDALSGGRAVELGSSFDLHLVRDVEERLPIHLQAAPVLDTRGTTTALVVMVHEIGGLALHHSLSRLPERRLFATRVADALYQAADQGLGVAVIALRLERLQTVQESLPPDMAARLVDRLGARMRELARHPDIARAAEFASSGILGGSTFVLLAGGLRDDTMLPRMAQIAVDISGQPIELDGMELVIPASVGVAFANERGHSEALINAAGRAADVAAKRGGARYEIYADTLDARAGLQLQLEADLRRGMAAGELVLDYQPIVSVHTGRVTGFEALARWRHPERGIVPPNEFIPIAEESGLIRDLGSWALTAACRQLQEWNGVVLPETTVAVNVALGQLTDDRFIDFVHAALRESGLAPERLVLEITESAIVADDDAVAELLRITRDLGVSVAIDDFGTGYSSLRYLRRFPVEILKIDRSFVAGMDRESSDAAIVSGIVRLGHALGINVVAEGVETEEQLRHLRMIGCDMAQGFHLARPMPAGEVGPFLERHAESVRVVETDRTAGDDVQVGALEEEADDALGYLAHELKGPVTAIMGFSELLSDELETASNDSLRYLDAVRRNAESLLGVIGTMTDARAVGRGTFKLVTDQVDLAKLVQEVLIDCAPLLGGHRVVEHLEPDIVCAADSPRLTQAIRNLLSNAVKYSPASTEIEVTARGFGGVGEIGVRDRGPGIPEERRHLLFRKFARLTRGQGGMGIGLHLTRAIARAHAGDAGYEPAPGGGSYFWLRLPRSG